MSNTNYPNLNPQLQNAKDAVVNSKVRGRLSHIHSSGGFCSSRRGTLCDASIYSGSFFLVGVCCFATQSALSTTEAVLHFDSNLADFFLSTVLVHN